MSFKSLFLGLLFISALSAHAATQKSVTQIDETATNYNKTSSENRIDKKFVLTLEPAGFAVSPIPTLGGNAGLYLSPRAILQAEYAAGSLGLGFYDLGTKMLGVNLKYFTGNSFYLKGGLDYRRISISGVRCLFCSDPNFSLDAGSTDSISIDVGLGNQWQWDNFTLGCDWFGVTLPVVTQYTNAFHNSSVSAQDQARIDEAFDRVAKVVSFQILRVYLGASF